MGKVGKTMHNIVGIKVIENRLCVELDDGTFTKLAGVEVIWLMNELRKHLDKKHLLNRFEDLAENTYWMSREETFKYADKHNPEFSCNLEKL